MTARLAFSSVLLCLAAPLAGCDKLECGDGTHLDEDENTCVPDIDPHATYSAFTGTLTVLTVVDDVTQCDMEIELTGTEYTGPCEGCTFAFDIDAEITRDDNTADCSIHPAVTFLPNDYWVYPILAHADYIPFRNLTNVMTTGLHYQFLSYVYPNPYWFYLWYEGSHYGEMERTGNDIAWTLELYYVDYASVYYKACDGADYLSATGPAGGESGTSTLPCTGDTVDVWSFDGEASGTATVSVDTMSDNTAFDPWIYVNDGDGCTVGFGDDSFTCTYPPPAWACPGGDVDTDEETYQVVVGSFGACAGTGTGSYQINVDTGGTPNLTLLHDDVAAYHDVVTTWDVEGSGTLVK